MLFLLALPVVGCVALLWRYLQIYAPSNILVRRVRSVPPHWRTVLVLVALGAAMLVAMHVVSQAIGRGAPGWLNVVVLVLAWDAIKFAILTVMTLGRAAVGSPRKMQFAPSREHPEPRAN
jgi:hypothetical protein